MNKILIDRINSASKSLLSWDPVIAIGSVGMGFVTTDYLGKLTANMTDVYSLSIMGGITSATIVTVSFGALSKLFNRQGFVKAMDEIADSSLPYGFGIIGAMGAAQHHADFPAVAQHLKNMF